MKTLKLSPKVTDLLIYSIGIIMTISFVGYSIVMYEKSTDKRDFLLAEHYGDRYFFGYHGYKDKALIHYKEALQLEPENEIMHGKICRTYYHLCVIKNTACEEAVVQLNKSIDKFPDAEVLENYQNGILKNMNNKANQVVVVNGE